MLSGRIVGRVREILVLLGEGFLTLEISVFWLVIGVLPVEISVALLGIGVLSVKISVALLGIRVLSVEISVIGLIGVSTGTSIVVVIPLALLLTVGFLPNEIAAWILRSE